MSEKGKEIAAAIAITKNLDKKTDRNLTLEINQLAEKLAKKDLILNIEHSQMLGEILDMISSGKSKKKSDSIAIIGSRIERKGSPVSWYRNFIFFWKECCAVDVRNKRLLDFLEGMVHDFEKKRSMAMQDADIVDFMKGVASSDDHR